MENHHQLEIESWRAELGDETTELALAVLRGEHRYNLQTSQAVDSYADLAPEVYRALVRQWNDHAPIMSADSRA